MRRLLAYFICLGLVTFLSADEPKRPTVCLNMIVKNETKVIERCLESVKPFIDTWVIVDTGSTDGTQKLIKKVMKKIPGKLYERPWVNFAHNRNEALALAKDQADYLFFIDADDILTYSECFKKPLLDKDAYHIKIKYSGTLYERIQLVKSQLNWKWEGVVHEVLTCPEVRSIDTLQDVAFTIMGGGDRSQDPKKFLKDAALLEKSLKENPGDPRTVFYLAQSYRDAGKLERALEVYEDRILMAGWDQEVFWSMYQIAMIEQALKMSDDKVCSGFTKAFQYRPSRAEPVYRLSNLHRMNGNYLLGYLYAQFGLTIPQSSDAVFVESWIYEYGLLLELSICAYWIGRYEESMIASKKILAMNSLPVNIRECAEKNLRFAQDKLAEREKEQLDNREAS